MEKMCSRTRWCGSVRSMSAVVVTYWLLLVTVGHVEAQEEQVLDYTIYEDVPANTFIADIIKDAGLRDKYTPEELAQFQYSIISQSGPYTDYFTIGEGSGVLRTAKTVDREVVCPQKTACPIKVDLAIQPREFFQIIKTNINVEDKNDNAPKFADGHFSRSIAENTAPGTSFSIPSATDLDSPKYGVKRYELISGAPEFELKVTNTSVGSMDLSLVLKANLDRETRELYTTVVAAYDGGVPQKTGMLTIDIIILDVNDNNPLFEKSLYEVSVAEDVAVDTVVVQVKATDLDIGSNGLVTYGFTAKSVQDYGKWFAINNRTGQIYVKKNLDYEITHVYELGVTARDGDPESLPAEAKVVIQVADVNDHAPKITINAMTSTGHVEIPEGEGKGAFVAHISVEDPDSGKNGQFSCSVNSPAFSLQKLYATEYKLVTADTIDREVSPQYDIAVQCRDEGDPPLTSTTHVTITILDNNDNAPKFTKQTYSIVLPEDIPAGSVIVQVNATDPDMGNNAKVRYSAVGDAVQFLDINPITGNITSKVTFDYEKNERLEFTILAEDAGTPPLTSTATLLLKFLDVDDEIPKFTQNVYDFSVLENQPLGTEVGQVTATDADAPPFDQFMFFLDPSVGPKNTFVIEPQSGKIFTRVPLDREAATEYQLVVMAISKHAPTISNTALLNIQVDDENDNSPVIYFPNVHNNTVHVTSRTAVGASVAQIIAHDVDTEKNSLLSYAITGSTKGNYFAIDSNTGIIRVRSNLMSLDETVFQLKISVRDNGVRQHTVETTLNIIVNKSADLPVGGNNNLTIVISVVTVTIFVTILLTVAIICTRKQETKERKQRYQHKVMVEEKVMVVPPVAQETTVVRTASIQEIKPTQHDSGYDMSFMHDVTMEDEKAPASGPASLNAAGMGQQQLGGGRTRPTSYREGGTEAGGSRLPSSSSYPFGLPLRTPSLDCHVMACETRRPPPSPTKTTNDTTNFHLHVLDTRNLQQHERAHEMAPNDADSESNTSSVLSNADSGRGSNEDADSGPSLPPAEPNTHAHDGVILRPPPRKSAMKPNSNSFTAHLSNVVQRKQDHLQTFNTAQDDKKPVPPTRLKNPPGAKPPKPTRRPPPPPVKISTNSTHATMDSSWAEDETEGDMSDESLEHVYYVNASQV